MPCDVVRRDRMMDGLLTPKKPERTRAGGRAGEGWGYRWERTDFGKKGGGEGYYTPLERLTLTTTYYK